MNDHATAPTGEAAAAPAIAPESAPLVWRDALGLIAERTSQLKAVLTVLQNAIADNNRAATESAVNLAAYLTESISDTYSTDPSGQTVPAP